MKNKIMALVSFCMIYSCANTIIGEYGSATDQTSISSKLNNVELYIKKKKSILPYKY